MLSSASLAAVDLPTHDELRAERARRSLSLFLKDAWHVIEPGVEYKHGWHIDCIAEHLTAQSCGELPDLIVNMPPRHMKSSLIAVMWPAWEWLTRPHVKWLFASYALSLSVRDSLKTRRLIVSPWYQERWGHVYQLTDDQNAKLRFENDRSGYRLATSVGGAATGEGGDRIVVDDPHNVKQAESEVVRESTLSWWSESMSTRRNDPDASTRTIVMQRVHERDLTGYVLAEKEGYHHLVLPARYERKVMISAAMTPQEVAETERRNADVANHDECPIYADPRTEEGTPLWQERYHDRALTQLEKDLGPYAAPAQLQQRPSPRGGSIFKPAKFRPLPADFDVPGEDGRTKRQKLAIVQFWDLAYSELDSADYTASLNLGVDAEENLYVLHAWRKRIDEEAHAAVLSAVIAATKPDRVGIERKLFKKNAELATADLIRQISRKLTAEGVAVPLVAIPVADDKVTRAMLPASRMDVDQVYCDVKAPWYNAFANELSKFPNGANDDWVDAFSGATALAITGEAHKAAAAKATPQRVGPAKVETYGFGAAGRKDDDADAEWFNRGRRR